MAERWCDRLGVGACPWNLPDSWLLHDAAPATDGVSGGNDDDEPRDLVAGGADLKAATLVTAYCRGMFPMPINRRGMVGWWSPDPRAVLPLDALRASRSLRRSVRRYEIRVDTAFDEVIRRCGDPRRPHGWISRPIIAAYGRLHRLGIAHSVEAWADDRLVGGLYGVQIGGLFAGESMFHSERDASKVALVALVERLSTTPNAILDVQWSTPHLESLGVVTVPRSVYLGRLARALDADEFTSIRRDPS
ncbi:MAG TPA: leucyl/phenylalanyl-tRNA--protein transferase [Microthrixaceae bacterium]|nr:leucyl/phenylalanyl-tRNA--protein transferase [Microthrixaceae bacterium]